MMINNKIIEQIQTFINEEFSISHESEDSFDYEFLKF